MRSTFGLYSADVTKDGNHPVPRRPTRRHAASEWPPNHTSGCGSWTGLGSRVTLVTEKKRPSKVTSVSVQSLTMSSTASSVRAARSLRGIPNNWCSEGNGDPSPKTGMIRPSDNTSRLASSFASRIGLRPGRTRTLVPYFSRFERPIAAPIAARGSSTSPATRSENHRESQPTDSHASMSDQKPSAPIPADAPIPGPMPTRTFIADILTVSSDRALRDPAHKPHDLAHGRQQRDADEGPEGRLGSEHHQPR